MTRRTWLVVALVALALAALNAPLFSFVRHERSVEGSGVEASAPVVRTTAGGGRFTVTFTPPGGGSRRSVDVDAATFRRASDERVLAVRYPEGSPADYVVPGAVDSSSGFPTWVLVADGVVVLLGLLLALTVGRGRVRRAGDRYLGTAAA